MARQTESDVKPLAPAADKAESQPPSSRSDASPSTTPRPRKMPSSEASDSQPGGVPITTPTTTRAERRATNAANAQKATDDSSPSPAGTQAASAGIRPRDRRPAAKAGGVPAATNPPSTAARPVARRPAVRTTAASAAAVNNDPTLLVTHDGLGRKALNLINTEKKNQSFEIIEQDGKPAARIAWLPGAKPLAEAVVRERPLLVAFEQGVTLTVPVRAAGISETIGVGIRLQDANGEIWQFGGMKVPERSDDWTDIIFDLSRRKGVESYGGPELGKGRIDLPVRLFAVLFNLNGTVTAERFLLVGDIRRNAFDPADVEAATRLLPLTVTVETGLPIPLVLKGKESELKIVVANPETAPAITFDLGATLTTDVGPEKKWQTTGITLAPGEIKRFSVENGLSAYGIVSVLPELRTADGKGQINKPALDVAYLDPAGNRKLPPTDGFWFGLDARIRDKTLWAPEIAALIGADILRGGKNWSDLEPSPGEWNWKEHDRDLGLLAEQGLAALSSITFTPGWAAQDGYSEKIKAEGAPEWRIGRAPPKTIPLQQAIQVIVEKNKVYQVPHYDLWNEPDLKGFWMGSTDDYLQFMRTAYPAIKAVRPDAVVLSGGIATLGTHRGHELNPDLIRRLIIDGQDHYDALSLHMHGPFKGFATAIETVVAEYQKQLKEPKPLYFTETGVPIGPALDADDVAGELVKKIAYAKARGALGYIWFILRYAGGDSEMYAMITSKDQPRPALVAYNEVVKMLRDTRFRERLDAGDGNWLLAFDGREESIYLAWNEDASSDGQSFMLGVPQDASVTAVDLMGNAASLKNFDGTVEIALQKRPVYYRVPKGGTRSLGPLVVFSERPVGEPGRRTTISATCLNPLGRPAAYVLTWTDPAGQTTRQTLELGPNGKVFAAYDLSIPAARTGDSPPVVRLDYRLVDTPWSGSLSLALRVATLIPNSTVDDRKPDFTLSEYPRQIFNANENDPNLRQFTWQGASDLSAKVWLRREPESLVLTVEVADDVHKQPHPSENIWQADGLQIGLAIPGKLDFWEIAVARNDRGENLVQAFSTPLGLSPDYAPSVAVTTKIIPGGLSYEVRLPLAGSGITVDQLRTQAVGFNLIVNDDDGGGREGFAFLAEGLGKSKSALAWPLLIFE